MIKLTNKVGNGIMAIFNNILIMINNKIPSKLVMFRLHKKVQFCLHHFLCQSLFIINISTLAPHFMELQLTQKQGTICF